jgi:hypothetical protein
MMEYLLTGAARLDADDGRRRNRDRIDVPVHSLYPIYTLSRPYQSQSFSICVLFSLSRSRYLKDLIFSVIYPNLIDIHQK